MLDFQLTQYPFRLGLAEGTDPRQVPPGTLVTAENCVWKQAGRLEKRFGVTALTSLGTGVARRLFTRGQELVATDGTSLLTYAPSTNAWRNADQVPDLGLTWTTLADTQIGVACSSQGYYGGLMLTAHLSGNARGVVSNSTVQVQVQIVDVATGAIAAGFTTNVATSIGGLSVVVIGSVAHVVILSSTGQWITAVPFDLTTATMVNAGTVLRTDGLLSGTCVAATAIGTSLVVAYEDNLNHLRLASFTYAAGVYTLVTSTTITGEAGTTFSNLALDGTAGESLYVVYTRNNAGTYSAAIAVANPATLVQSVAPVSLQVLPANGQNVSVKRLTNASCVAMWSAVGPGTPGVAYSVVVSNAGVVSANTRRGTNSAEWASHPFYVGTRLYAVILDNPIGTTAPAAGTTTGLVEIETYDRGAASVPPHRYAGRIDILVGGGSARGYMPSPQILSATEVRVAVPFLTEVPSSVTSWRAGLRELAVTAGASAPLDLWRAITVGREAYVSGGVLSAYDGRICFDYAVSRNAPFTTTPGVGGNMAAGNYLYGIVPEYHSGAGMLHRGPTFVSSAPVPVAATGTVTLGSLLSVSLESKQDVANGGFLANPRPTALALYRSVVNGSVLQRLTQEPVNNVITDNAAVQSQSYVDAAADAGAVTLASRPAIYTTGGILDDYAPPASVTMFHHADRLWVLAGDQKTWWYSKAFQDDLGTAPGFHPNFRVTFAETQVAGAKLDDKAIFFSATGVRYLLGMGPAPNGQNSDFQGPFVIQSDVGCTSARSVVGTPEGVMFLSDRGLYLLTRGLELVWIGRDVQNTLAAYPVVTSAVLVAKQNQVRFTCNNAAGTTGVVLVWDYVTKQWSSSKYNDGTTYGCAIADACMWSGAWTFATPAGLVFTESTATYLDAGVFVPMTLETAWISAAGPLAFQSMREMTLHGTSNTDHDLTVSVGFDSDPSYPQAHTFLATTPVTAVGDEECTIIIGTRRKCSHIRFKIADATPTAPGVLGIGRGPSWDMMALEVGVKRGTKTNPATKRA